jgi:hypothetical protein
MRDKLVFRSWFYFRQGWSTYFAFIFAAINTLTVTYYLAIEKYPTLKDIFPTFFQYIVIIVSIGIPLLVIIGYVHYKRSSAYAAEADITIESHPHFKRLITNMELLLVLNLKLSHFMVRISKNEPLSEKELEEFSEIQKKLSTQIDEKTFQVK